MPLTLLTLHTPHSPTGLLIQHEALVEWLFLPNHTRRTLTVYLDLFGTLLQVGQKHAQQLIGLDPSTIVLPLTKAQIETALQNNVSWQIVLSQFVVNLSSHYPFMPLLSFLK